MIPADALAVATTTKADVMSNPTAASNASNTAIPATAITTTTNNKSLSVYAEIPLKVGKKCVVVNWNDYARVPDDERYTNPDSDSENDDAYTNSEGEKVGGSGSCNGSALASEIPAAIADDPFFAQLLRNAELYGKDTASKKKKPSRRRRARDYEDEYDINDPFIDDSELTFLDGHAHTHRHRTRKLRISKKKNGVAANCNSPDDEEDEIIDLDQFDRANSEDFFVYYGPLKDPDDGDSDAFDLPAGDWDGCSNSNTPANGANPRSKKRAGDKEKKGKEVATNGTKRKGGAASTTSDGNAKPSADGSRAARKKSRHSGTGSVKEGADTPATAATGKTKSLRPPLPPTSNMQPGKASSAKKKGSVKATDAPLTQNTSRSGGARLAATTTTTTTTTTPKIANLLSRLSEEPEEKAGLSQVLSSPPASQQQSADIVTPVTGASTTQHSSKANLIASHKAMMREMHETPSPELARTLADFAKQAREEPFENRQKFPTALKPLMRDVCDAAMRQTLRTEKKLLSLDTPEAVVLEWSPTPDMVDIAGTYRALAETLPYNVATVRKLVTKLIGTAAVEWWERRLQQVKDAIGERIKDAIERGEGWVKVNSRSSSAHDKEGKKLAAAAAASGDEGGEATGQGEQMRWHWTTVCKHLVYQYVTTYLDIFRQRNAIIEGKGSVPAVTKESQARKDAYAHLSTLWPPNKITTYEISRAYSSRKSLLRKANPDQQYQQQQSPERQAQEKSKKASSPNRQQQEDTRGETPDTVATPQMDSAEQPQLVTGRDRHHQTQKQQQKQQQQQSGLAGDTCRSQVYELQTPTHQSPTNIQGYPPLVMEEQQDGGMYGRGSPSPSPSSSSFNQHRSPPLPLLPPPLPLSRMSGNGSGYDRRSPQFVSAAVSRGDGTAATNGGHANEHHYQHCSPRVTKTPSTAPYSPPLPSLSQTWGSPHTVGYQQQAQMHPSRVAAHIQDEVRRAVGAEVVSPSLLPQAAGSSQRISPHQHARHHHAHSGYSSHRIHTQQYAASGTNYSSAASPPRHGPSHGEDVTDRYPHNHRQYDGHLVPYQQQAYNKSMSVASLTSPSRSPGLLGSHTVSGSNSSNNNSSTHYHRQRQQQQYEYGHPSGRYSHQHPSPPNY